MKRAAFVLMLCIATVAQAQPPREPTRRGKPGVIIPPPPAVGVPPTRVPFVTERVEAKRDVVVRWNEVALEAIKAEKTPPPIAARNLAMLHVAIYDAVNAVDRHYAFFAVNASAPRNTSPEAAAAVAAHRTLLALYPKRIRTFDAALDASLASIPPGAAKTNGMSMGQAIAESVLDWRGQDGKEQKVAYKPSTEPGRWQPTPPDFRPPLLPEWAGVPCFGLNEASTFHAPGPPALTSKEFESSYQQVLELGSAKSKTRTREQTEIAHFWADGEGTVTPPGHWNRIAATVAAQRGTSLAENARLFAMLNCAMADAAISCWECKYKCDFWRPVTAIRSAASLKNPHLPEDPNWTPLLTTPPFPAYTSGHSTFSGAAAAVLAKFFGTDEVRFTTTSDALPGVTRSFNGFRAAAEEAGMSRIYGGIHWQFDNVDGLKLGSDIGEHVAKNFFRAR